jgi:hypothetical protein
MNDTAIEQVDVLLNKLENEYSSNPYYLKETLKKIKNLVYHANLQADKLITAELFKNFNAKDTIDTLTREFPSLKWEEDICGYNYKAEGTLGRLVIKVSIALALLATDSKYCLTPYWELDIYLDDNDSCIELYNSTITKFNTLFELVTVAKQTLRPLCNLFSKLEIT